jgi:nucleotide-binding universal stress UspA family protein
MATILVPTDFMEAGKNASDYAAQLAEELNYDLLLFHVYNMPVIVSPDVTGTMMVDNEQLRQDINKRLKEEANRLAKDRKIVVNTKTVSGMTVDEIVTIEKEISPAMIVMGHRTRGDVEEFVFGSAATGMLRKAHSPLLIVPENAKFKKLENILFPDDHKFDDVVDLDPTIKKIFKTYNSTIHIVTIIPEQTAASGSTQAVATNEKIENYFGDTFHIYHVVENNDVAEGLNSFVERNRIDLVTMMPHKHNLFEKLFIGGVTRKMAFHTRVPLLSLSHHLHKISSPKP